MKIINSLILLPLSEYILVERMFQKEDPFNELIKTTNDVEEISKWGAKNLDLIFNIPGRIGISSEEKEPELLIKYLFRTWSLTGIVLVFDADYGKYGKTLFFKKGEIVGEDNSSALTNQMLYSGGITHLINSERTLVEIQDAINAECSYLGKEEIYRSLKQEDYTNINSLLYLYEDFSRRYNIELEM